MATSITLADLFPCDDGTVLVARDAIDGSRRHISEVANGLRCGCVCFGCGRDLIARNGGDIALRRHSFAHRPDELSPNCATAGETALHILGKEIIAQHGRVTMPDTWMTDLDGRRRPVTPLQSIDLTDIRLEVTEDDVIPDIVAISPEDRRLFIEIKNTHGCSPEKLEKLASMDIDVLEIDVSGYRDHPLDDLDEVILDLAPRVVIQSAALRSMAATLAEERIAREVARRDRATRRVAIYHDGRMENSPHASELADQLIALGFSGQLDRDDGKPSAFQVPRRQWQAAILYRLGETTHQDNVGVAGILERLRKRKWPKPDLDFISSDDTNWIAEHIDPDFRSAYEEVASYMKRLQRAGVVFEDMTGRFRMNQAGRDRILRLIAERSRPTVRRQKLDDALDEIRELLIPSDGDWVNVDAWLGERAADLDTTLVDLLQKEDGRFDHLIGALNTIRISINRMRRFEQDEQPDDLAGLPLESLFLRLQTERFEAQKRAELEQAECLKVAAEDRVSQALRAAIWEFSDPNSWMDTARPEYGEKSPRELAAESSVGLGKVLEDISKVRERRVVAQRAEDLRATMLRELQAEVDRALPRQELAELWMKQSWPQLGRARPQDFCVDERTLARCLEVLAETQRMQKRRR